MPSYLMIERVEFLGRCGITAQERQIPQPLAVDVELDYPDQEFQAAVQSDSISQAIDYANVVDRIIAVGTAREYALVETLAESLTVTLLSDFRIRRIRLWVRKLAPPLKTVSGSVGIRVDRTVCRSDTETVPARFLTEHLAVLPKGTILDVAAGQGRNALCLAGEGYSVEAVDHDQAALAALSNAAKERHLPNVRVHCVDLETNPEILKEHYDGIIVFFFLYRPLISLLIQALKPGGVLIYETFLIDNHLRHHHPRRREFCLDHNELLHLTKGLRILHYDEGQRDEKDAEAGAFTARLVARREPT